MRRIEQKKKPNFTTKPPKKEPFFTGVQAKVSIGEPNDHYEKEADVMADVVTKGGTANSAIKSKSSSQAEAQAKPLAAQITPLVQRTLEDKSQAKIQRAEEEAQTKIQRQEEEEAAQPKVQMMEEEEPQAKLQRAEEEEAQTKIQRQEEEEAAQPKVQMMEEEEAQAKGASKSEVKPSMEATLKSKKGSGSKMDSKTKTEMEAGFGADFSGVNVHTDSEAQEMSQDIGAQAFTYGNDVYFNQGKYNPQSQEGKHLLAHELTHTIQQKGPKKLQKQDKPSTQTAPPAKNTPGLTPAKPNAKKSTLFGDAMAKLKTINPLCYSYLNMATLNGAEVEIKKESHTGIDLVYKFKLATMASSGSQMALFTDVDLNLDKASKPPAVISQTKIELDKTILTAASTPDLVNRFAQDMYHECIHLILNIDLIRNKIAKDSSQDTAFTKELKTYKTAVKRLAEYAILEVDLASYILTKVPTLPASEASKVAESILPEITEEKFVISKAEKAFGGASTNLQIAGTYLLDLLTKVGVPTSTSSKTFLKLAADMGSILDNADKKIAPSPKKTP